MPRTRETKIDEANVCSFKQMVRWLRRRKVETAEVALIRFVPEKAAEPQTEYQHVKSEVVGGFHRYIPNNIKAVLAEFSDVLP